MEKKLLLLGLLRDHEMHGYQLNEVLAARLVTAVSLSKANAYKLLKQLEAAGLVSSYTEQAGNRPPRRVYAITPAGEAAFLDLLRASLAHTERPEFPALVALNFLHALPAAEALTLLGERRAQLAEQLDELADLPADVLQAHLSLDFFYHFYRAELDWLDGVIARLEAGELTAPPPAHDLAD